MELQQQIAIAEMISGLPYEDLTRTTKKPEFIYPKHLAIYVMRFKYDIDSIKLGKLFSMDHTSVLHACNVIYNYIITDERKREQIYKIMGYDLPVTEIGI